MKLITFFKPDAATLIPLIRAFEEDGADEVVFLCTPRDFSQRHIDGIKKTLGLKTRCFLFSTDVRREMISEGEDIFSGDSLLEISGGKGELLYYAVAYAKRKKISIVSFDKSAGYISSVYGGYRPHYVYPKFTVEELISGGGAATKGQNHSLGSESAEFESDVLSVAQLCLRDAHLWSKFGAELAGAISRSGVRGRTIGPDIESGVSKRYRSLFERYLAELEKRKILKIKKTGGGTSVEFKTVKMKNLFCDIGAWLEYYTYFMLKKSGFFDDTRLSVRVDWDGDFNDFASAVCEIDVVATCSSVPLFISCKLSEVSKESLYEIRLLADRFGGKGCPAALVTGADVLGYSTEVYRKAMELEVALIEGPDIERGELAAQCIKALKGNYSYRLFFGEDEI